ncbi:MAG: hypothetical protein JNJ83_08635 [Verrucomicrobiaceae bacterium]|nr:hypothetical protein [Verrucomicrobiaceae bacterium]
MSAIDFESLWHAVINEPHQRDVFSVHGPDHWRRVERNGCILAARTGANVDVVRLFAIFHDCKRENDGHDPGHGRRGGEFAAKVRGKWFDLPDPDFQRLYLACERHTEALHHSDPTIGTCWDADRLDLGRVGAVPDPYYMSTEFGREIARQGVIHPWLHLAVPVLGAGVGALLGEG